MAVQVIDYKSKTAAQDFTAALKDIGFAVIENPPVNAQLMADVYALWDAFFKSPEKFDFTFDPETHDGFISKELSETAKGYGVKDLKEFYHFYLNGRCPEKCKPKTIELYKDLQALGLELLAWVDANTPEAVRKGFSMPLPDMVRGCPKTLLRIIHYPPLTGNEPKDALRAAAHEDINMMTLLPAATADGLQVKNSKGEWLAVPCNPSWIIVNVSDMLQECSDHYYPSTSHRVINPTGEAAKKSRLSMPMFMHPWDDVRLSAKRTAQSYREERFAEIGLDAKK